MYMGLPFSTTQRRSHYLQVLGLCQSYGNPAATLINQSLDSKRNCSFGTKAGFRSSLSQTGSKLTFESNCNVFLVHNRTLILLLKPSRDSSKSKSSNSVRTRFELGRALLGARCVLKNNGFDACYPGVRTRLEL